MLRPLIKRKRFFQWGVSLILTGILCFGLFHMIGSNVTASGLLDEPFALLPIGYAFLFIGIILFLRSLFQ